MSDDRERWLMDRLVKLRAERDRYRGWFEKLLVAAFDPRELQQTVAMVKREHTEAARRARSADTDRRRKRSAELVAEGLSYAAIGRKIAREEGRPDRPYTYGQVRGWLAKKGDD